MGEIWILSVCSNVIFYLPGVFVKIIEEFNIWMHRIVLIGSLEWALKHQHWLLLWVCWRGAACKYLRQPIRCLEIISVTNQRLCLLHKKCVGGFMVTSHPGQHIRNVLLLPQLLIFCGSLQSCDAELLATLFFRLNV